MKKNELRNNLTNSLSKMYKMEVNGKLTEFWRGELRVLLYLYQHSQFEINPSELSDALEVSRARITTALSALRKKNYVTMQICENDRRRMLVSITPEGIGFVDSKQKNVEALFDNLIEGLGEKKTAELVDLINLSIEITGQSGFEDIPSDDDGCEWATES